MYLMLRRKISTLESFLSGGYVGRIFLNSKNAMFTFCCRHRSRLLVANMLLSTPNVFAARTRFSMSEVENSVLEKKAIANGVERSMIKLSNW